MPVKLYMDHCVDIAIANGLIRRGIDVITCKDDHTTQLQDPSLLDRATELGRVLFTNDDDYLAEARKRQISGQPFSGVIYIHQNNVNIGQCIDDLQTIAVVNEPDDHQNKVFFLPL